MSNKKKMGDIGGYGVRRERMWRRAGMMVGGVEREGRSRDEEKVECVSICAIQQKMTVKDIDPQTQDRTKKRNRKQGKGMEGPHRLYL